jgi:hypothetical protein
MWRERHYSVVHANVWLKLQRICHLDLQLFQPQSCDDALQK